MKTTRVVDPEHYTDFMRTYAQAMLTWQLVEQNVFFIFSHVVKSNAQYPVVSAIYHTIINFSAKLEMVDAAMKMAYHNNAKLDEWRSLQKNITGYSRLRNTLAHSTIMLHKNRGKSTLRLSPSAFDVRDGQDTQYTLKQIAHWLVLFQGLARDTSAFAESINAAVPAHRNINFTDKKFVAT